MILLLMALLMRAEDPVYVVNEENCKFAHFIELPNDYRSRRLMKACFESIKDEPMPTGGNLQEKTVRPLKEFMGISVDLR
ncbi:MULTISPECIES: hypothetical protein [Pseudomonas]|uniref:Uncharacterized protein n=1 Tax=Pseudomonas tritici TaxID=2745518 RepID=A0A8I0CZG6_9PSED|nr:MULTISPECIES: hypothetical protein [Pseudomonas]MBP2870157.1 hypothetical protein [Pseudomonas sp. SWRI144]QXH81470.1 hypothetical protein HU722_0015695 [Pseudomonas tritici]CRL97643.1 hypothetical protein [Pseudomonas sp. 24 R 17]CRM15705.1 hypothetical protein [Pseudomonas sp. 24 E 1]CRM23120.1 hypothetical protein [Pseudomonas sp. 52 E 6]